MSVKTQHKVIFLEDLCKIFDCFLLFQFGNLEILGCLKQILRQCLCFRQPKISVFLVEHVPEPPLALPLPAKLAPSKTKKIVYSPEYLPSTCSSDASKFTLKSRGQRKHEIGLA